jgi:hypothetical protein
MTTFVEMSLIWILRIAAVIVGMTIFFQGFLEIPVFDIYADLTYEFGTEVPEIVLNHTTSTWQLEHNCHIGNICQGEPFWELD